MKKLEERHGLRYQRIFFPEERESWYRARFGAVDLYDPRASHPEAEPIQETSKSRVFRIDDAAPGRGDAGLFLKEERYGFPNIILGLVARPRVLREFRNLAVLRSIGCPAVEPLAVGVIGWGPFYRDSFLITAEFARAQTLKDWSRSSPAAALARGDVAAALLGFARVLGRVHRGGYCFRTLYAKNLLVRAAEPGGAEITVCDTPRLWRATRRALPDRASMGWAHFLMACFDLACLDKWAAVVYSGRERLRFLRVYLAELRAGPPRRNWIRWAGLLSRHLRHETPLGRFRKKFRRRLLKYGLNRYWPF